MIEIKPAGASDTHNWLIFADPSAGKTTLIGSGGKVYKILLIRPPVVHVDPIVGSGVQEAVVHDWEDMTEIRQMLAHVKDDEWDWVWLDDLSSWDDVGLYDVYQGTLDRKGPPGSAARNDRAQYYADKGEYNVNAQRISELVRDLVGSSAFNFGMTAHAWWAPRFITDDEAEEDTESEQIVPMVRVRGMSQKMCGYMNLVGYLEVAERRGKSGDKKQYRRMHTEKGPRIYAKCQYKDSSGNNPFGENGIIVNPTLPDMMKVVEGARRPTRTPRQRPAVRRRRKA